VLRTAETRSLTIRLAPGDAQRPILARKSLLLDHMSTTALRRAEPQNQQTFPTPNILDAGGVDSLRALLVAAAGGAGRYRPHFHIGQNWDWNDRVTSQRRSGTHCAALPVRRHTAPTTPSASGGEPGPGGGTAGAGELLLLPAFPSPCFRGWSLCCSLDSFRGLII